MNPHSIPRLDGDPDTGYFRREDFKTFEPQTYQREILSRLDSSHDTRTIMESTGSRINVLSLGEGEPQTVVHIQIGPDVSPDDVARIMAGAPPGAHFILHTRSGLAVLDGPMMRATRDPTALAERFIQLWNSVNHGTQTMREFSDSLYKAATESKPKPITYGPQRHNRKGKPRRW